MTIDARIDYERLRAAEERECLRRIGTCAKCSQLVFRDYSTGEWSVCDCSSTPITFQVTTQDDLDSGGGCPIWQTVEAHTPQAAARKYGDVRACDYWDEDAESHVGERVTIIVLDGDDNETRIETAYE